MLETAIRIVGIIFPVFACAGLGALYATRCRPDMKIVNKLNMEVFSPFLIFWALTDKPFDLTGYTELMIGGIAVILGSGLLLLPLVTLFKLNLKTFLPPMMFNNAGNMGLPLILFAFGEEMLQAAVVLFIVEMLLHFTIGIYLLDHKTRLLSLIRMPMVMATVLGIGFSVFHIHLPEPVDNTIELLAQVAIPLMLFSLGVRLLDVNFKDWKQGVFGAIAGPLASILSVMMILLFIDLSDTQTAVLLVFAALPPAVLNVLVAEQYQQEPARVASIVMIGNLASVVIMPLVLWYVLV